MRITAVNYPTDNLEKTYLDTPISGGATTLTVKNNEGFSDNDQLLVGELGGEKSEIVSSTATSGASSITISATDFAHEVDTPIYVLPFDQVVFYRSTTGENGTYDTLATVALDVDNADLTTEYDDTSSTSSYYYKTQFRHSTHLVVSQYSDPIPAPGYKRNQVGYIIDQLQQEVSDQAEQHVTRTEWLSYFNDVNDDLLTYAGRPFEFLKTRTTLTRTANTNYIDFPTDDNGDQIMWKFDRLDYLFTDSTVSPATNITYTLNVLPPEEFRNRYSDNTIDATTVDDRTTAVSLDTSVNRFRFHKAFATTGAAVFYLHYWKYFTKLDSEGDEIETPTPRVYKLYSKSMYYQKRAATEPTYQRLADSYMSQYIAERSRLTSHNRKDAGTPRNFSLPTPTYRTYRG